MTPFQREALRVYRDSGVQDMLDQLVAQFAEVLVHRFIPPELLPPDQQFTPPPPPSRVPRPPSSPPPPYAVLGVSPGDPMEMVEAVWRAKAKFYHPDAPGGNAVRFQQL